jgi:hypothetical protein
VEPLPGVRNTFAITGDYERMVGEPSHEDLPP